MGSGATTDMMCCKGAKNECTIAGVLVFFLSLIISLSSTPLFACCEQWASMKSDRYAMHHMFAAETATSSEQARIAEEAVRRTLIAHPHLDDL
jgi:hypothetical protein